MPATTSEVDGIVVTGTRIERRAAVDEGSCSQLAATTRPIPTHEIVVVYWNLHCGYEVAHAAALDRPLQTELHGEGVEKAFDSFFETSVDFERDRDRRILCDCEGNVFVQGGVEIFRIERARLYFE
jgi:hypothetical protein